MLFSILLGSMVLLIQVLSDAFAQIDWLNFQDTITGLYGGSYMGKLFLLIQLPAMMMIIGRVAGTEVLLIVAVATVQFRYREHRPSLL